MKIKSDEEQSGIGKERQDVAVATYRYGLIEHCHLA
jgi:hypothetical protein